MTEIETVSKDGVVNHEHVRVSDTTLDLSNRNLVRLVGLEKASEVTKQLKLKNNRFVDVPPWVFALTQLQVLYVRCVLCLFWCC
jgi:Leucine-rich repeat (LRR) protein